MLLGCSGVRQEDSSPLLKLLEEQCVCNKETPPCFISALTSQQTHKQTRCPYRCVGVVPVIS